jgi:two-component system sensor histidine kinase KdpD
MTNLESGTLQIVPEPQPVDEVIGAALSYVEDRLRNHIVKTRVDADLPFISVDEILIQQALVNVLENATKYAPAGSEIEIGAEAEGDRVTIAISDRGPGIREEHKKKIFDKFFREQPNKCSGAGLGLAICSSIVEAHGGSIWVEDNPGGGSVFKLKVPSGALAPDVDFEKEDLSESVNYDV